MSEAKLLQQDEQYSDTMTRDAVHQFIKQQPSKQTTRYKTFNNFVADYPKHEFHIHVAYFLKGSNNYALVCVDVFIRFANDVAISTDNRYEIVQALKK